jgi:hypothetical protein
MLVAHPPAEPARATDLDLLTQAVAMHTSEGADAPGYDDRQTCARTTAGKDAAPQPTTADRALCCPHCDMRTHHKGEEVQVGRAPVGGARDNTRGRYKVRIKPRKENTLGKWNHKHGYRGLPYCKSCSESFRSHLLHNRIRPRSGCSRAAPCDHCRKILAGFNCLPDVLCQPT